MLPPPDRIFLIVLLGGNEQSDIHIYNANWSVWYTWRWTKLLSPFPNIHLIKKRDPQWTAEKDRVFIGEKKDKS